MEEHDRLEALRAYRVLDSLPEVEYQDIVELAAFICDVPISLVSFVDSDRQWFKSEVGLGVSETPRSQSFCAHTLTSAQTLIVPDALEDTRFRDNPLVLGHPDIRFYAGAPIVEAGGNVLGTVCVIDRKPRELSPRQVSALEALARQVVVLLNQRKAVNDLEQASKSAEEAGLLIRESERKLDSFVNSLPALAWIANADGFITSYNRRWYDYTGTTPAQMEGWGWQSVHDPNVLPSVLALWTSSIQTGESFEMTFPLRGADGVFRPFLTRIEPMRDDAGQITNWVGTNTEVDALLKTQLALERSEDIRNQVLNATTDAVISVGRDWNITYMNPRAEVLYGPASHLVGRNLWEAFPEAVYEGSPFVEHYYRAMDQGISGKFEAEYGQPLNFTIGLEVYPGRDGIVTFSRDITAFKHATAAVLQNEKLAAVGRMASTMAHEINNPLEAVTNLLFLSRRAQNLEEAEPYMEAADGELRRVAAIVNRTLRFHRQSTRPSEIIFTELFEGMLVGQHSRLENAGVRVSERDRTSSPITCLEGEIRQVLVNLIGNAIDAMHGTGGTLFIRGRDGQNWKTGERGMVITVADSGTGMSESAKARAFEAFYSTKGIGGTGLGLWLSREIIDRHHGCLTFRTRQGGPYSGTVFEVFLPRTYTPGEAKSH